MIALQIMLLLSSGVGLWFSIVNLRRAQEQYNSWRAGQDNGLTLQVASHHVRIAVANLVLEVNQMVIACIVVTIMWLQRFDLDLPLVMLTGLATAGLLMMVKQLMYSYDRALIMDVAIAEKKGQK